MGFKNVGSARNALMLTFAPQKITAYYATFFLA